jgi:phage-related protein
MLVRKITTFGNYFTDFYQEQDLKVQSKIEYVFDLLRYEKYIPSKFFKLLMNTEGIYEIRVLTTFKSIRILCFYDDNSVLVLLNCFIKKTDKVPKREILLAERLKGEYMNEKYGGFQNA